jgi:hypothetical protein
MSSTIGSAVAVCMQDLSVDRRSGWIARTCVLDVLRDQQGGRPPFECLGGVVSRGLGEAMVGINVDEIPEPHRLAERGW